MSTRLANRLPAAGALLCLALAAPSAQAALTGPAEGDGSVELDLDADADTDADDDTPQGPWIKRYGPRRNYFEVGLFGGVFLPADDIELHFRNLPYVNYESPVGEIGARVGYYPIPHFGIEGELGLIPGRTQTQQRALMYMARAHAVAQLGLYRIVPFVLVGGGVLAVDSEDSAAGDDADQALVVGGGVKYFVNRHVVLRLDVRDVMSPKRGRTVNDPADSIEVLLGFSVAIGPKEKEPEPEPPKDRDNDTFTDDVDECPDEVGIAPDGCPVRDTDEDGFSDDEDACPEDPGADPDGCPIPDTDEDGFLDPDDICPQEAGPAPDGCPIRDIDGDGMLEPEDKCPTRPETRNGFEDDDGCPDDLPEEVKKFTGVIEGIYFATGKAVIRDKSKPVLDEAVKVLQSYEALRVEISGHTDNVGKPDKNKKLSEDRADSVKKYLTDAGIDAARIETRGAGMDEPIEDNGTKEGRAKNRRIELKFTEK